MMLLLLILLPLLTGLICFASGKAGKALAIGGAAGTLGLAAAVVMMLMKSGTEETFSYQWMPDLGASFSLLGSKMALMLCLLTGIVQFVVVLHNQNKEVESPAAYYGLLMLTQAGLMGVFLASDALLFYFFWELALIPVYFLCSRWGGERRIPVTFKFFVYTFTGSLMLLAGLIYVYLQTGGNVYLSEAYLQGKTLEDAANAVSRHSYAWNDMVQAGSHLPAGAQQGLFWLFFAAFAIKMPIFPFHTWQPDTYETSPTPVTILLSALMVKMGLFGVLNWLQPILPAGCAYWAETVMVLSIIGIVYASCIALVQTDMKRLIAYSSIAHMGLMAAVAFAPQEGQNHLNGILVQMFNHGINITGMWLVVHLIETRYGTRDLTKLGGAATAVPKIAIALVVIAFANIALPLTNGFVGEFMLFHGLFQSSSPNHIWYMAIAGLGVILGAAYTLKMVQRVAFGNAVAVEGAITRDLTVNEWIGLGIIISIIIFLGVYPAPLISLVSGI